MNDKELAHFLGLCFHNILTHPLMPFAELLDRSKAKWCKQLAVRIWELHDKSMGELPRYEAYWKHKNPDPNSKKDTNHAG